jgi:hypothetical protein
VSRGPYPRGAFVGHWENNSLSNGEGLALRATRIASDSVVDRASIKTGAARIERMSADDRLGVEESASILRTIYSNYPHTLGVKVVPGVGASLRALRTSGETRVTEFLRRTR